jgi:hypothetical protein
VRWPKQTYASKQQRHQVSLMPHASLLEHIVEMGASRGITNTKFMTAISQAFSCHEEIGQFGLGDSKSIKFN